VSCADPRVDQRVENAAAILADIAVAPLHVAHVALARTERALDFAIRKLLVEAGFYGELGVVLCLRA
jgi:hypothetical protein